MKSRKKDKYVFLRLARTSNSTYYVFLSKNVSLIPISELKKENGEEIGSELAGDYLKINTRYCKYIANDTGNYKEGDYVYASQDIRTYNNILKECKKNVDYELFQKKAILIKVGENEMIIFNSDSEYEFVSADSEKDYLMNCLKNKTIISESDTFKEYIFDDFKIKEYNNPDFGLEIVKQ